MPGTHGRVPALLTACAAALALASAVPTAAGAAAPATPLPVAPGEGRVLGAGAPGALAGEYIVVLKSGSTTTNLAARYGGAERDRFTGTLRGFAARLSATAASRLAADPAVAYVEQDRIVRLTGVQRNPPSWGLDRIDQRAASRSRSYTYAASADNVHAYIVDTGVRTDHTDFGGRATYGWNFVDNTRTASDCNGHGTHVAGTVGGNSYGVAKGVRLVAVKVLDCRGVGKMSQVIAGIDWVTRNAVKPAVANLSLGGGADTALDQAVRASIAAGISYTVAAGNDARNACTTSPARVDTAITVGATGSSDARASFSNYGSCLDLFAPGVAIVSAGKASRTARASYSGTSMAAPHVAGAAAQILALHPTYTPDQVRAALAAAATTGKIKNRGAGSPDRLLYSVVTVPRAPVTTAACATQTNGTNYAVTTGGTLESKVTFAGCTTSMTGKVTLDIKLAGTRRGSVAMTLVAPNGTTHLVKAEDALDTMTGVNASYTLVVPAGARNGTWRLRVHHAIGSAAGYLDSWTLHL